MRWRIAVICIFLPSWLWLVSWHDGYEQQYCERVGRCAEYNLLEYGWLAVTHLIHVYESFFVVLLTLAIALFTYQLWKATKGLKDSTDRLWEAGELQRRVSQEANDQAREAFSAQLRPLVDFEDPVVAGDDAAEYDSGDCIFRIPFSVTVRNYGAAPASKVVMHTRPLKPLVDAKEQLDEFLAEIANQQSPLAKFGEIVFPDKTYQIGNVCLAYWASKANFEATILFVLDYRNGTTGVRFQTQRTYVVGCNTSVNPHTDTDFIIMKSKFTITRLPLANFAT